ncbi:MAG: tripartite tricarboxylate transporter substrate binding protein [Betaproteobacteria bacterium]|nr:tripartite tricarboxylate transporter substrate binding protein [Betaproteobacteria bacterium]
MNRQAASIVMHIAFALAVLIPALAGAQGEPYPSRPITMIVNVAPGGGSDLLARVIAPKLGAALKQPVVVENKVGASGVIGSDFVAKAAPNGYTLLLIANSYTITPAVYKNMPFDPIDDLVAVARLANTGYSFTVNPKNVPAKDAKEFVALAKTNPGKYTYATPGKGTAFHLAMEVMKHELNLDLLHVPHKDLGSSLTSMLNGSTDVMFAVSTLVQSHARTGALRVLAVTGSKRSPLLADVPTFRESGMSFMDDVDGYYGVLVPAKTPREIVIRLNREIAPALALTDVTQKLVASDLVASPSTPEQFAMQLRSDILRWGRVVREAGITAE